MVSQEIIDELKTIINEDYGQDLPFAEVAQIANGLVGYFDLFAKIYHQEKIKNDYGNGENANE